MTGNVCPTVIDDGEAIYSFGGYRGAGSLAVAAGGDGDVTDSHVQWTSPLSSYVAAPLRHDGNFYWINDRGIAFCSSPEDGRIVYRERFADPSLRRQEGLKVPRKKRTKRRLRKSEKGCRRRRPTGEERGSM
ncbi:MAG: hypothetical protein AAF961_02095 [Planctomycetota bacterium]